MKLEGPLWANRAAQHLRGSRVEPSDALRARLRPPSPTEIESFWEWFREATRHDLAPVARGSSLDVEARQRHPSVAFGVKLEPRRTPRGPELIVSAGGIRLVAPRVEAIVGDRTNVGDWRVRAFRPRTVVQLLRHGSLNVPIEDARVVVVRTAEAIDLEVFVPGLDPSDALGATSTVLDVLDELLGERTVMARLGLLTVDRLLPRIPVEDAIPLSELPRHVER